METETPLIPAFNFGSDLSTSRFSGKTRAFETMLLATDKVCYTGPFLLDSYEGIREHNPCILPIRYCLIPFPSGKCSSGPRFSEARLALK